jgi:hypothetical protein
MSPEDDVAPRAPQPPDTGALLAAISEVGVGLHPEQEAALRLAVCNYVDAAKAAGMWPEQIVITVRNAATAANPNLAPMILERIIEWCLKHYHNGTT